MVSLQDADVAAGNSTAQKLVGLVERKTLKQTVMTQVYGVTQYGAREQIKGRNYRGGGCTPGTVAPEISR